MVERQISQTRTESAQYRARRGQGLEIHKRDPIQLLKEKMRN